MSAELAYQKKVRMTVRLKALFDYLRCMEKRAMVMTEKARETKSLVI